MIINLSTESNEAQGMDKNNLSLRAYEKIKLN